jgi:hypothetical protein
VFATEARYREVIDYVKMRLKLYAEGKEYDDGDGGSPSVVVVSSEVPDLSKVSGTLSGYGPVNAWWKMSRAALTKILSRMQRKNVRVFPVEVVGNANEDMLANAVKLAQMKDRYVHVLAECGSRGIIFNPIGLNDNAGDNNYSNGGVKLAARVPQARALYDWMAARGGVGCTLHTPVAETQTSDGHSLQAYAATVLGRAGYRLCTNDSSRVQQNASWSQEFCYHNTSVGDWPKSKKGYVLSDTGSAIRQLSGGRLDGPGDPAALRRWLAAGVARGQKIVAYYAFQYAGYDEAAIDAMSIAAAAPPEQDDHDDGDATPSGNDSIDLSKVEWNARDADVRAWPVTQSLEVEIWNQVVNHAFDVAKWPDATVLGKKMAANTWVVAKAGGRWCASTWEWLQRHNLDKNMRGKTFGGHIKVGPLKSWHPRPGERFHVFVSGLARTGARNVKERSNVVEVVWQ